MNETPDERRERERAALAARIREREAPAQPYLSIIDALLAALEAEAKAVWYARREP